MDFNQLLNNFCLEMARIGKEFNESYPELQCDSMTRLMIDESVYRNRIMSNYRSQLLDIIENHNSLVMIINRICCVCEKLTDIYFRCKNKHSEVVCSECGLKMFSTSKSNRIKCPICRNLLLLSYHSLGKSLFQELDEKLDLESLFNYNKDSYIDHIKVKTGYIREYNKHLLVPINKQWYNDIFTKGKSWHPINESSIDDFSEDDSENEYIPSDYDVSDTD